MTQNEAPTNLVIPSSSLSDAHVSRRALLAWLGAGSAALGVGCADDGKASQAAAIAAVDIALGLVERDVSQVRAGMPEGAKLLATRLPGDLGSRAEVQTAIKATREKIDNLSFAKSTFFSFASPEGVVLRSEIDPDRFVDQNAIKAFPELAKALEPNAGLAEAYGELEALRGVKKGPDLAWIVAAAVPGGEGGKPRGLFLTGWSMRLYARLLQDSTRAKLAESSKDKESKQIPLIYVYVLKGKGAYGDPDAPDLNAEELVKLDLVGQLGAAPEVKLSKEIEKRVFGIAAKKVPQFGDDAAIAVVANVF